MCIRFTKEENNKLGFDQNINKLSTITTNDNGVTNGSDLDSE